MNAEDHRKQEYVAIEIDFPDIFSVDVCVAGV
jgi:hypothetical protein